MPDYFDSISESDDLKNDESDSFTNNIPELIKWTDLLTTKHYNSSVLYMHGL